MSVTGGDGGIPAAGVGGDGGIPTAGDGGPAVATFSGGGACTSCARRGETSGGACGFVRTPIEAFLVATDSSRREEHDGSLGFTRFITVRKLWAIYETETKWSLRNSVSGDYLGCLSVVAS